MKKIISLLSFLAVSVMTFSQNPMAISLNNGWQFSEASKNEWKEAVVPGSVQSDLIRLGKLPDPYYGTNENLVQWPEEKDWDYKMSFNPTAERS